MIPNNGEATFELRVSLGTVLALMFGVLVVPFLLPRPLDIGFIAFLALTMAYMFARLRWVDKHYGILLSRVPDPMRPLCCPNWFELTVSRWWDWRRSIFLPRPLNPEQFRVFERMGTTSMESRLGVLTSIITFYNLYGLPATVKLFHQKYENARASYLELLAKKGRSSPLLVEPVFREVIKDNRVRWVIGEKNPWGEKELLCMEYRFQDNEVRILLADVQSDESLPTAPAQPLTTEQVVAQLQKRGVLP